MSSSTSQFDELQSWIGRQEVNVDYVTIPLVIRLAATLDRDDPPPKNGDPLPAGWHWTLFPRVVPRSQIGRDGHPQLGDFLPPVPLPRRMFAGNRSTFHADLQVGDEVKRTSEIAAITPKQGRSGAMVFVTVRHTIETERGLAMVEEQDIVYREETPSGSGSTPANAKQGARTVPTTATWIQPQVVDEVTLFRFSALSFNGHRIHYDHPYVTQVEGYPGLVQNGGLTTVHVYEMIRAHTDRPLKYVSTRNMSPLFGGDRFLVCGEPENDGRSARLWVAREDGTQILDGSCEFA
ncbi:MAG: MaoC family dehydratase N-terminal domain-containing protein [Gammaproteobacteria bacterium]|nr:MaoC family dehydratase N-terminal domain-containing protein [Gammaproteobacteria bacterium]